MVEADPSDGSLLDGAAEGCSCSGGPVVGRVVELDDEAVVREVDGVDGCGVFDIVDGEVIGEGFFLEPEFCGVDEGFVDAAVFGNGEDFEGGLRVEGWA